MEDHYAPVKQEEGFTGRTTTLHFFSPYIGILNALLDKFFFSRLLRGIDSFRPFGLFDCAFPAERCPEEDGSGARFCALPPFTVKKIAAPAPEMIPSN